MKTIFSLFMLSILWLHIDAQAPQAFKYQAVARDNSGNILSSKNVNFRISILQGSTTGTVVYSELQAKTTSAFGLVDMEIGKGSSPSGDFTAINWGNSTYFVKVEMDPNGGAAYQHLGTSQLLSVPYALYAKDVQNNNDADADPTNELQKISLSGTVLTLDKSGGSVTLPSPGSGGDNWGTQYVIGDATLSGQGTNGSPLKIAQQAATSGQVLKWSGTAWKPGTDLTGTVTAPGGNPGNVQFNNSGSFGGDADLTWDNNRKKLGIGTASPWSVLCVVDSTQGSVALSAYQAGKDYSYGISGGQGRMVSFGINAGVIGYSTHETGTGVYALGYSSTGENFGLKGASASTSGTAVFGNASATSGTNYGVKGNTASPNGYSGYFTGGKFYVDGNVGIGTATPSANLEIAGTIGPNLIINDNGGADRPGIQFKNNQVQFIGGDDLSDKIFAFCSLFSNTRSYNTKIQVHGHATSNWGTYLGLSHDGTDGIINTDVGDIALLPATGRVGIGTNTPNYNLDVRGTIGNNTTLYHSDKRWKTNIRPLKYSIDDLIKLNGVSYLWNIKDFPEMKFDTLVQFGFIAQDFEKVIPELVRTDMDGFKSIDYVKLIPVLVEAIKEQEKIIKGMKTEDDRLKSKLSQMKMDYDARLSKLESMVGATSNK